MKNLITIIFLLCAFSMSAQLPFDITSSNAKKVTKGQTASEAPLGSESAFPWMGGSLLRVLSGDTIKDFFEVTGRVMYVAASGANYAVPFMTSINLSQPDSIGINSGGSIGVFPYYQLTSSGNLKLLLHSGLDLQIPNIGDDDMRFKASLGFQAAFYLNTGRPVTLNVAPEFTWNIGDVQSSSSGLGLTGIVPIANGLGLIAKGVIPFDNTIQTPVSLGIVINDQLGR